MKSEGDRLRAMRELELKKRDRARLRTLQHQIRELRRGRRGRIATIRAACREARHRVKLQIQRLREETRAELAAKIRKLRDEQRGGCALSKSEAHAELERAIGRLELERDEQRAYNVRHYGRKKTAPGEAKRRAAERRSESDDEVRHNLPPELIPVFNRMKGQIKGSDRRTRTEAFLQWVHDNEGEAHAIVYDAVERDLARFMAEQSALEQRVRGGYRKTEHLAAALAEVPF